jgi:hypothetical protein
MDTRLEELRNRHLSFFAAPDAFLRDPLLPADFDPALYLKANPDVARAGMFPAYHYLVYGRFEEDRKLRPA